MLMTQSPATHSDTRRLLGLEPAVFGFVALALLITAGVLALQLHLRVGVYDPETEAIFYRLFIFEDYPASFLFVPALLIAAMPGCQRLAGQLAAAIGEHPLFTTLVSGMVFAIGALYVYHAHPLSMDESAPYMQSKIFAHGALVGKYPPSLIDWLIDRDFRNYFIHVSRQTGEIASSYWPGFALLLTPFMLAGVPWLCNPVLGAASVWVIHRLTLRLTDSTKAAGAAVLFSLASAAFTIDSISFYSMTAHLLCNAVFALLLLNPSPARCAVAGLVGGLALTLHNPIPHMTFALAWLVWLMTQKNRWTLLGSIVAGYLPWVVLVGFGWAHLLHALADPAVTAAKEAGASGQVASALTRFTAVFKIPGEEQLLSRLVGISKLWLWASPLLLLLAGFGFARHRKNPHMQLLLASAVTTLIVYMFVPLDQGHGWGYRYFHSAWFVLPVFAAAALVSPRTGETTDGNASTHPLVAWSLAATFAGLLIMTPYYSWQVRSFIGQQLAQLPQAHHGTPRVVVINPAYGYYTKDLVLNDPFLAGPVIRMGTRGERSDEAMMAREFPDLVLLEKSPQGSVWGYASKQP